MITYHRDIFQYEMHTNDSGSRTSEKSKYSEYTISSQKRTSYGTESKKEHVSLKSANMHDRQSLLDCDKQVLPHAWGITRVCAKLWSRQDTCTRMINSKDRSIQWS